MHTFDELIHRRGTDCKKWDGMAPLFGSDELLPLWIADMDFACPDCVVEAVQKRAAHPIYGYAQPSKNYAPAFAAWCAKRHDWPIDPKWVTHSPGVVSALAGALMTFTAPGDGVIIMPPVYPPFAGTTEGTGRRVINAQMRYEGGRFEIDFEALEAVAPQGRAIVLCNPHNPTGRVFTRDELLKIEAIAKANDLLVISDEIHADIVYEGRHIPFASLSDWARDHSLVLMAPSKTFNIAGMATSTIVVPNDRLRAHYERTMGGALHIGGGNVFGLVACEAAFAGAEDWLEELLVYLKGNVEFVERELARRVPKVRLVHPEGTYVPLLDFSATGLSGKELGTFLREKCRCALNDGFTFGPGGDPFARLNIATPRANLEEFVNRLEKAFA